MSAPLLTIVPGAIALEQLQAIHAGGVRLAIDPAADAAIRASAAVVQRAASGNEPVYGVNTGFGKLATTRIDSASLDRLQLNLIRSHSVGVGAPLGAGVVRLMLALKAASLARGASGVRPIVIDTLVAAYNAGLVPCVPSQGSVGASGDLAPLAHMTLALIGEGETVDADGRCHPAGEALRAAGIEPLTLSAKEGLALINGTQVSTALALHALLTFEPVLEAALVVGALTVDAARGSDGPFDPRIHALRGQPGQIDVACYYRALLDGSAIRRSHLRGRRPGAGPVQPALPAAGRGRLPRQPAPRGAGAAARGQCGDRQPAGSSATEPRLRRQLPRRAGGAGRRRDGAGHRRGRRHRRAPHRHADRRRRLAPAAVPHRRRRPEQRLHDRPRHGGVARLGEQVAGASGERRLRCRRRPTRKTTSPWRPSPRGACSR